MKTILNTLILVAAIFFAGCAHSVHQVHVSDFSPKAAIENGKMITAKAEQFTIMGFVYDTNYVDQAYRQLQQQCPNGQITGITTERNTSLGFFSWTNRVIMQGLCI